MLKIGQYVILKLQSLLNVLYLEHILDTFGHCISIIRIGTSKKVKADQARKRKNMTFCLLQNTRNLQHICSRCNVTRRTAACTGMPTVKY